MVDDSSTSTKYPRVAIEYCTQCHWMLRAAWFAQELLSTFSNSVGEVALQPATGGTFTVHLFTSDGTNREDGKIRVQKYLLWDRKAEGGFPEAKELKRRVRDIIDPKRDLGHVDRKKPTEGAGATPSQAAPQLSQALNRLQAQLSPGSERKFTPMDVDPPSGNEGESVSKTTAVKGGTEDVDEDSGRSCPPGEECG